MIDNFEPRVFDSAQDIPELLGLSDSGQLSSS